MSTSPATVFPRKDMRTKDPILKVTSGLLLLMPSPADGATLTWPAAIAYPSFHEMRHTDGCLFGGNYRDMVECRRPTGRDVSLLPSRKPPGGSHKNQTAVNCYNKTYHN